jgi:hypothetical protein
MLWLLRYTVLVGFRLELVRYLVSERGICSYLIVIYNPELKLVYGPVYSLQLFSSEAPLRSSFLFSFELSK